MDTGTGRERSDAIELVHYHVGGDGQRALEAFLEGYRARRATPVESTTYDNTRLQVKVRILTGDPPDVWTDWPGATLRAYTDANALADVSAIFESTGMADNYRDVALEAARVEGVCHAVPYSMHRINDLYVNVDRADAMGVSPDDAETPREFARQLSEVAQEDAAAYLLPMKEPWPVLQLWEVVLLGQYDHKTFEEVIAGRSARHRDAIQDCLDIVATIAEVAPDDAAYTSLVDANERFIAGKAPVYAQGDWVGGVFVDADGFTYEEDWRRVAFPGTEDMYVVNMDAMAPSSEAEMDAIRPFLEHAGSTDGQIAFTRAKGSLPTRTDAPTDELSAFGQDQAREIKRTQTQPQSIAHGLAVTPRTRIELLDVIASFLTDWDSTAAAEAIVDVFDS